MRRNFIVTLFIALIAAGCFTVWTTQTPVSAQSPDELTGIVVDAEGPVAGATVRIKLTDNTTITVDNGSFTLPNVTFTEPVSVTAWAEGYYVGSGTATPDLEPVTITLKPHYTTDNLDYDWFVFQDIVGSASCEPCHTGYVEWKADAHSQSATNPRFLSMYQGTDVDGNQGVQNLDYKGRPLPPDPDKPYYGPGYKLDNPDRDGNCASCHAPVASKLEPSNTCGWLGCHTNVTASRSDQVPYGVNPVHVTGEAADGVSCDFCHKIGDVKLDPETQLPHADKPGILSMKLYRPEEGEQLFFGTYDDVPRRVTYLPLQEESAFCASCHYGVFGGVVANNSVVGGIEVYNSYGEWLDSPYNDPETGQTCQDCHMPPVENKYFVFPEQGGFERDYKPVHNHLMPGVTDEELMQNSVAMTTDAEIAGDEVAVEVSITNDRTGHHVPTGAPMRHMMLVVQARDADGNLLELIDGPTLPDWTGNYAGEAGRYYAKILQDDWTGEAPTAAYWRNISLVEDTRLAAFATDVSEYAFAAPAEGPVMVEAQLVYRRAFQQLMEEKGWDDPDLIMEEDVVEVLP